MKPIAATIRTTCLMSPRFDDPYARKARKSSVPPIAKIVRPAPMITVIRCWKSGCTAPSR